MIATFAAFAIQEYSGSPCGHVVLSGLVNCSKAMRSEKSRQSITEMMSIAPSYANLEKDGQISQVDPEDVAVGDIIVIRPGEKIPLDGTAIEGESFIDTAALTGESVPRKARTGDNVISGCLNGDGTLKVCVAKKYEDSTCCK